MKIRIIGEKSEIETFCKNLGKAFPDMAKSKLCTAREGGYRCYIDVKDSAKGGEKMTLNTKIQIEALKRLEKNLPVSYAQGVDSTYLTVDGYSAIKIPNDSFFLDKSKLRESENLTSFFSISQTKLHKLNDTHCRRPYDKGVVVCFESEDDAVYCDEKLLKNLSIEGAEIFTNKAKTRIHLAKDGEIYAIIAPFNPHRLEKKDVEV